MESLTIALPESIKSFVESRVTEGEYGSASDYVRDLILADQKRRTEERIDARLIEGLHSGDPIEVTPEYWDVKKRSLSMRTNEQNAP